MSLKYFHIIFYILIFHINNIIIIIKITIKRDDKAEEKCRRAVPESAGGHRRQRIRGGDGIRY